MPSGPSSSAGSVVALWRYPVKSMLGEELNATEVTPRGLVGDRQFAVIDRVTGKVAGAKNPRKWGNFFEFQAAYTETPHPVSKLPAVRLTLPDGSQTTSEQPDLVHKLSRALGREVAFARIESGGSSKNQAEEYWPDLDGLEFRDTVTDFELPEGTFFDLAVVHLLTTSTLDRLRKLYPEGRFEARRFRPNIVVSTPGQGFVENDWVGHTVAIGDEVRLQITRHLRPLRDDDPGAGRPAEGSGDPAHRRAEEQRQRGRLRRRDRRRHDPARRPGRAGFVTACQASAGLRRTYP